MTARHALYVIVCVYFLISGSMVLLSTLNLPALSSNGIMIASLFPAIFGLMTFFDAFFSGKEEVGWEDAIGWGLFAAFFGITAILLYVDPVGMANLT